MIVLGQVNELRTKIDSVAVYQILKVVAADVNLSIDAINVAKTLTIPRVQPKLADLARGANAQIVYEAMRTMRQAINEANAQVAAPFLVLAQIEQMRLFPANPAYLYETCRGLINATNVLAMAAGR